MTKADYLRDDKQRALALALRDLATQLNRMADQIDQDLEPFDPKTRPRRRVQQALRERKAF